MDVSDLLDVGSNINVYFKNFFGLWSGNTELLASCRSISNGNIYREHDVIRVVIKALWKKLRETHVLRVVK